MGYNNKIYSGYQADVATLDTLRAFIAGGRNKVTRPLANNTTARLLDDGGIAIRLHQTDIVTLTPRGTVVLNSGGWLSATTKERLNRYTNAGISQRAGVWYMRDGSLFYDGMELAADGTPLKPRDSDKYEEKLAKIKAQAKQYAHDYVEALKNGLIDYPNGGDCWACLMRGPKGQESFPGSGHIQDHINEKYYVPSLLVNAGRDAGYRDEQIGLMGIGGRRLFIEPNRIIYKYIVKQLRRDI